MKERREGSKSKIGEQFATIDNNSNIEHKVPERMPKQSLCGLYKSYMNILQCNLVFAMHYIQTENDCMLEGSYIMSEHIET